MPVALLGLLGLLSLNLLHDHADLLGFRTKSSQELFARLLRATKAAKADVVGMLLTAVDAEAHAAVSSLSGFNLAARSFPQTRPMR